MKHAAMGTHRYVHWYPKAKDNDIILHHIMEDFLEAPENQQLDIPLLQDNSKCSTEEIGLSHPQPSGLSS